MKHILILSLLLALASTTAFAAPVTWYLSGVRFGDGGTGSGSFVYDASSNKYSSVNIATTAGSAGPGGHYVAVHPTFAMSPHYVRVVTLASGDLTNTPFLVLTLATAMTDAGGTIQITPDSSSTYSEFKCSTAGCTYTTQVRRLTAGSIGTMPPGTPPPVIFAGGVVPVYSPVNTIQPGEWVSIYGTNLAGATALWDNDFPTSLDGTSVTIDGKPAYLWYVSPGQINLQVPDDTNTGTVTVVVTTAAGTGTSAATLAAVAPAFLLFDTRHVAGIIVRTDGSGACGGGTYDFIGPTGSSLGFPAVAAKAGDVVELYGTGFGPTNPAVPAGRAFSGAAWAVDAVSIQIDNWNVTTSFAGQSGAGLVQINLTIPSGLGTGDVPLAATVGGVETPSGVVISLQ